MIISYVIGFLSDDMDIFKEAMIISMWAVLICLPISMKCGPLKEKDNSVFHYFQLLDSYWCDNPEPKTNCSGNADKSDMKNQLCNFKCNNTWENITCMDSEKGALYFCIPKDTTCVEGITWKVDWERSALKEGVLAIVDDHCPQDSYQEKHSKCYNACKEKHEPLAIIPKPFKILSKGNHTHPTMLMCNNTAGYFSSKNQTIFHYDKSFKYSYHDLCVHNVTNACVDGQINNGSCVIKCRHGNVEGQANSECIEQPSTEPVSPPPTGKDSEAPNKEYSDNSEGSDVSKGLPTWVIVIIVIISVIIAIACCCCCYRYCDLDRVNNIRGTCTAGQEYAKVQIDTITQQMVSEFCEYMKSVGALMCKGNVTGTVFRVGEHHLLTAHHVIRIIIESGDGHSFDAFKRDDVFVNFNCSVGTPPFYLYKVQPVFKSTDPSLDFAVLKILNPVQLPPKMCLYNSNNHNLTVQELSGIGYGNPENENNKVLDPNCKIITITDKINACEAWLNGDRIKDFDDIKFHMQWSKRTPKEYYEKALLESDKWQGIPAKVGYAGIDTSSSIFVDISLQKGGSGSPFLTSNGIVFAMLTHGCPEFYFQLPKYIQCNFPKKRRFECLLRLDLVFEHINERDPQLASELF